MFLPAPGVMGTVTETSAGCNWLLANELSRFHNSENYSCGEQVQLIDCWLLQDIDRCINEHANALCQVVFFAI